MLNTKQRYNSLNYLIREKEQYCYTFALIIELNLDYPPCDYTFLLNFLKKKKTSTKHQCLSFFSSPSNNRKGKIVKCKKKICFNDLEKKNPMKNCIIGKVSNELKMVNNGNKKN